MALSLSSLARMRVRIPATVLVTLVMVVLAVAAAIGAIALSGTKTGFVLSLAAVLGPITLYLALVRPLLFPFGIFVLLVPFDNLLTFSTASTLTRGLAILSGLAIAVFLLRTRRFVKPDRGLIVWVALLLLMFVSFAWSYDTQAGAALLMTWTQLFLLYAAITFLPVDERTLRSVVSLVLAGGVLASLYGAYVFHAGLDVSNNGRLFLTNDEATIDPNHFAAALILPFAIALSAVASARRLPVRLFAGVTIAILAIGLAIAGSRGGLIACAAIMVYLCIRSRHRVTLGAIGLAGAALGLAFHGDVLARFSTAMSSGGAGRADIWRVGLVAFREHWLFGAGFGSFPVAFDQAFLRVSESYYTSWHRAPHNILIGTAVELGIVGLVILCLGWWCEFRALRIVPPNDRLYELRIALEAAVIGLFISGFFLDIMIRKYVWLAFILVALTRNVVRSRPRARVMMNTLPSMEHRT